jgi:hypothetical protein
MESNGVNGSPAATLRRPMIDVPGMQAVQVAVCGQTGALYAVSTAGQVYTFDKQDGSWVQLPMAIRRAA